MRGSKSINGQLSGTWQQGRSKKEATVRNAQNNRFTASSSRAEMKMIGVHTSTQYSDLNAKGPFQGRITVIFSSQEAEITKDQHYFCCCCTATNSREPNRQETRLPSKLGRCTLLKNCAGKFFIGELQQEGRREKFWSKN